MFGIAPEVWFPLAAAAVGTMGGYALKIIGDACNAKHLSAREREARREQRRDTRQLRHLEFQWQTLLDLQDAIQRLTRLTMMIRLKGSSSPAPEQWLEDPMEADLLQARTEVIKLHVRVQDDEIRERARTLNRLCVEVAMSSSRSASEAAQEAVIGELGSLHERIGSVFRSLDGDEYQTACKD